MRRPIAVVDTIVPLKTGHSAQYWTNVVKARLTAKGETNVKTRRKHRKLRRRG